MGNLILSLRISLPFFPLLARNGKRARNPMCRAGPGYRRGRRSPRAPNCKSPKKFMLIKLYMYMSPQRERKNVSFFYRMHLSFLFFVFQLPTCRSFWKACSHASAFMAISSKICSHVHSFFISLSPVSTKCQNTCVFSSFSSLPDLSLFSLSSHHKARTPSPTTSLVTVLRHH